MARRGCLILQRSTGWQLAALGLAAGEAVELESAAPDSLADRVAEFVRRQGLASDRLLLAVDAEAVLTSSFAATAEERQARRMMSYALERDLPLAAEEFVADFIVCGEHVLGAAAEIDQFLPLVVALEQRGLRLQSISPAVLMAVQSVSREVALNEFDWLIWEHESACELLGLQLGGVAKWHHLPKRAEALRRQLVFQVVEAASQLRVVTIGVTPETQSLLDEFDELNCHSVRPLSLTEHVIRCSEAVLAGRETPWVELRRDALAGHDPLRSIRSALNWLSLAVAVFMITVSFASWAQVYRNHRGVQRLEQRQVALFREGFPESRVPPAIASRLRSEYAKLAGAHGEADAGQLPAPALPILYRFIQGLAGLTQFSVRELRIENGLLDVDVQLNSHASANTLVAALREQGFTIEPPYTLQQGGDVVARIFGSIESNPSPEREEVP